MGCNSGGTVTIGCSSGEIVVFVVIFCLLVDVLIAFLVGVKAKEKGYSFLGFFWVAILFGLIAVLIVACLPDRQD